MVTFQKCITVVYITKAQHSYSTGHSFMKSHKRSTYENEMSNGKNKIRHRGTHSVKAVSHQQQQQHKKISRTKKNEKVRNGYEKTAKNVFARCRVVLVV